MKSSVLTWTCTLLVLALSACASAGGPSLVGPPPDRPGDVLTGWREPLQINPGYRLLLRNNTMQRVRVTSVRLYDCFNVKERCHVWDPDVVLEPGRVLRVIILHPDNELERWSYRWGWAYEPVPPK